MHEILIQLPESKQTPLWAYGLVVDVYGKRDGRDVKITLWNRHPPQDEWGGQAAYYKNIAIPLSIAASLEPVVEQPRVLAASGEFQRSAIM